MVRAVRFAVRLNFHLDARTRTAIRRHAGCVVSVSGERILDELSKMLSGGSAAKALRMLKDLKLAQKLRLEEVPPAQWPAAVRVVVARSYGPAVCRQPSDRAFREPAIVFAIPARVRPACV